MTHVFIYVFCFNDNGERSNSSISLHTHILQHHNINEPIPWHHRPPNAIGNWYLLYSRLVNQLFGSFDAILCENRFFSFDGRFSLFCSISVISENKKKKRKIRLNFFFRHWMREISISIELKIGLLIWWEDYSPRTHTHIHSFRKRERGQFSSWCLFLISLEAIDDLDRLVCCCCRGIFDMKSKSIWKKFSLPCSQACWVSFIMDALLFIAHILIAMDK